MNGSGLVWWIVAALASYAPATAQSCKSYQVGKGTGGGPPDPYHGGGFVSDNGRWVLFDGPHAQSQFPRKSHVWLRDEFLGVTTQVDLSTSGQPAASWSKAMDLSGDGSVVLFWSHAANLVPGDTNGVVDLFARDLSSGVTTRVSVSSTGEQANAASFRGVLSADGRIVAFESTATNLVPGDTNATGDVFVHDRLTGQTERVNVASDGSQSNGPAWHPAISPDGRLVLFTSWATNLVPGDVNGEGDVFLRDRQLGLTTAISLNPSGFTASGYSEQGWLTPDGRYVAFSSWASDLVPGDTNGRADAFLRDTWSGTTQRLSLGATGNELFEDSFAGPISADGSVAIFSSASPLVTPDDTDGDFDVFRFDVSIGSVSLVSEGWAGQPFPLAGNHYPRDMTPDARFVSFSSEYTVYLRGCPQPAARYGSAKPNSAGCYPWITWSGVPSASSGSGFIVRADGKLNQVPGLFVYGHQAAPDAPLLPYLLVGPPLFRLPGASTGGSTTGNDCSGSLQVDFNAWIVSGVDPLLAAGFTVYGQFWSRDPGQPPPSNYGFSEAIEITLLP